MGKLEVVSDFHDCIQDIELRVTRRLNEFWSQASFSQLQFVSELQRSLSYGRWALLYKNRRLEET